MAHACTDPDHLTAMAAERDLVARLRKRDPEAFEDVVRSCGGRLMAVARRLVGDDETARDVVQDALLSAFKGIDRFDGGSQVATWLHRIVVNTALMRLRSRRRRPEQPLDDLLPSFAPDGHHAEPVDSWAEGGDRVLEQKQAIALVREGIAQLPEAHRVVLTLRDIEGLSTREVVELLGGTENAIKLRLHRARQALGTIIRRRLATRRPVDVSSIELPGVANATTTLHAATISDRSPESSESGRFAASATLLAAL